MATYTGSIDRTEANHGVKFTATVGSGGVTAGQPVKISADNTVVASTTTSDIVVGLAATTQSENDTVLVLGDGCLVVTPYTLTAATKVGVGSSGTAGTLVDYSTGTCVGYTFDSATTASWVRVQIQY